MLEADQNKVRAEIPGIGRLFEILTITSNLPKVYVLESICKNLNFSNYLVYSKIRKLKHFGKFHLTVLQPKCFHYPNIYPEILQHMNFISYILLLKNQCVSGLPQKIRPTRPRSCLDFGEHKAGAATAVHL